MNKSSDCNSADSRYKEIILTILIFVPLILILGLPYLTIDAIETIYFITFLGYIIIRFSKRLRTGSWKW
jgi:hypothetical protein